MPATFADRPPPPKAPPPPAVSAVSPGTLHPVDKSEHRIQTMFGEIAGRYDLMNRLLSGGVDIYWRWRTVRTCPPKGTAPILDTCTGTGDLALAYWNAAGQQTAVIGSDFTHQMLAHATAKRDKSSAQKTSSNSPAAPLVFLEADTQALPFASNTFQIVSVAFGLRNVTDTRLGLREMIRVCQPGGRVAILEFSMPANRLFRGVYVWYFRNILPRIGQLLAQNKQAAYEYLPSSVAQFPYGEELASIMRECGLGTVKFWPLTLGIATLYVGEKPG